jgi:hypothetical protein
MSGPVNVKGVRCSPDHPDLVPLDADREPLTYCGECGRIVPTDPDNDFCADCAEAILAKHTGGE